MIFGPFCALFGAALILWAMLGDVLIPLAKFSFGWGVVMAATLSTGVFLIIFGFVYMVEWYKSVPRD